MTPIIIFASTLLMVLVGAFAIALLAMCFGLILKAIAFVIRAVLGVVGIVLGGTADLVFSVLGLIPLAIHAGLALALVVLGRWERAEQRAARINSGFVGIGRRIARALWGRPVGTLAWIAGRGRRLEVVMEADAARPAAVGGAAARQQAVDVPPPPPPFMQPPAWTGNSSRVPSQEERTLGMLVHLLAFVAFAFPPLGNVIGPLVLWLARKDRMPYVDEQGRESLNFNITMAIAFVGGVILTPVLIGFAIVPVVLLAWVVLTIVAAVKAHAGEPWRYPICLRLIGPPATAAAARPAAHPSVTPVPHAVVARNTFPGYEVVGSLASGGSGARLLIAKPSAEIRRRLPDGLDRVVIKTFALSEGSTLPQIVRESRSMEAATRLGLVVEHRLEPGRFWYAMPYFPGSHFNEAVRSLHRLGPEEGLDAAGLRRVIEWTAGLAQTLDHYHRAGLWHKDVKPENVLVAGGQCRLVDIGLVTSLSSGMTLTTHGTEYFRDPEMVRLALRGVKVHEVDGAKFDIYGVGAMLYLGLEDTFPAHGGLSGFSKRSPECVRWVVRRAMADYGKRYPDAATLLADLRAILAADDLSKFRPAMLPSFRGSIADDEPSQATERVEVPTATPTGAAGSAGAATATVAARTARPRRSPWGLTSPGAARGAGRLLAALVLLAVGLIGSLVFASIVLRPVGVGSAASLVVIGPDGDLSGITERSSLFATVAERLKREHGMDSVQLVPADSELEARVRGVAKRLVPDSRLDGQGIDAAVVLESGTGMASIVARDVDRRSWIAREFGVGGGWEVAQIPVAEILPMPPGQRVLLLRDPTATAWLSEDELALWQRLGVELVEPSADDAAELAVWLAGDRSGPGVQERVREALDRYGAAELCRIRGPQPISSRGGMATALAADSSGVDRSFRESVESQARQVVREALRSSFE